MGEVPPYLNEIKRMDEERKDKVRKDEETREMKNRTLDTTELQ